MVARISTGKSITRMIYYNEHKVSQEKAQLIDAVHYGKETETLSLRQKQHRFEMLQDKNQNVKTNAVHISLNFDNSDKLTKDLLKQITSAYMEKIGFSNQPYLVYQHHDAGHPHVHIVTSNIKEDGKRIDLHNIGKNQSQQARKAIEIEFGLTQAEGRKQELKFEEKQQFAQRVIYGKSETKRAITNVLAHVIDQYKYTSLPELNAVLRQYNILADRGSENSRTYQKNGLVYRILDERGKKIGIPIKASSIYFKPTLKYLEAKFINNELQRVQHKQSLKIAIDYNLFRTQHSLKSFVNALEKQGVHTAIRHNDNGIVYGITYVDHRTKCVFNGSDLGKEYSAKGIVERCRLEGENNQKLQQLITHQLKPSITSSNGTTNDKKLHLEQTNKQSQNSSVQESLEELLKPELSHDNVPHQLLEKKRKKKRLRLHL